MLCLKGCESCGREKARREGNNRNRKAFHEYFVLERFEAGIELAGTEVKSIRAGNVNLKDAFSTIKGQESCSVRGMRAHRPYEHGNIFIKAPVVRAGF